MSSLTKPETGYQPWMNTKIVTINQLILWIYFLAIWETDDFSNLFIFRPGRRMILRNLNWVQKVQKWISQCSRKYCVVQEGENNLSDEWLSPLIQIPLNEYRASYYSERVREELWRISLCKSLNVMNSYHPIDKNRHHCCTALTFGPPTTPG